MFNCRNKKLDIFNIKNGSTGKIRLFFSILNNPWLTLQAINEFREECGKLEAELTEMKLKAADAISSLANAKMEIARLKEEALK